jgi:hypothetical protein
VRVCLFTTHVVMNLKRIASDDVSVNLIPKLGRECKQWRGRSFRTGAGKVSIGVRS